MKNLELILVLMALLAGLSAVATRLRLPYPVLLVVAGLVLGLIPGLPHVELDPDIVFLIFLPPLLYEDSFSLSWHSFKANSRAILLLAVGLVFFTMLLVAGCAHYLIPGFGWPLAFVLGAIVSPPDAVAASSATAGLNLPRKITTILRGEGLINDASALVAYRFAVAAVVSGSFVAWQAGVQFLLVAVGSVAIGAGVGYLFARIQARVLNSTIAATLTLLVPFVSYLLAEKVGASGVLAVVTTGLVLGWFSYEIYTTSTRLQNRSFWNVLVFLLNGFVFILIGLQLPSILQDMGPHSLPTAVGYGLLVSAVVIVVRTVWIFPVAYLSYFFGQLPGTTKAPLPNVRELAVISWSGMRGIISLATALALPLSLSNGHVFPQRSLLLFITFVVILVTLLLQSLTLPWLIRRLGVTDSSAESIAEEQRLRMELATSSLSLLQDEPPTPATNQVRTSYEKQLSRLRTTLNHPQSNPEDLNDDQQTFTDLVNLRLRLNAHQRRVLTRMHKDGNFQEEIIREIIRELDAQDLGLHQQLRAI